ncbi:deoxyribonuclease V [Desulfuromonas carbonis]|uniref:deoxyribonuclease V n=1 Tax=Desulfuromonas sp. DDH964 TaxID=1823759 RepID=UPI00078DEEDF|nr:deoxyribonuclease V [Desulfuromonas sp. DDH964]AMV71405.1 Endonuclease V [Desulfuromonas sp. DDH964]
MDIVELHAWEMDYRQAVALQRRLADQVVLQLPPGWQGRSVAGVDVSYEKHGELFFAAVVVLRFPELTPLAVATAQARVSFPYIPGLLSFRELPVLLEAFRRLETVPDAVLVDGQGIAHPRGLGLASHLGLWLGLPTVGCAKSRLCGEHAPPGPCRGDREVLLLEGAPVGAVLTTRDCVKPLYISPGHCIDIDSAVALALACGGRYRLPEPTRQAHLLTNRLRLAAREA